MTKQEKRLMKLLNLSYEELLANRIRIRLEAVKNHKVVFV